MLPIIHICCWVSPSAPLFLLTTTIPHPWPPPSTYTNTSRKLTLLTTVTSKPFSEQLDSFYSSKLANLNPEHWSVNKRPSKDVGGGYKWPQILFSYTETYLKTTEHKNPALNWIVVTDLILPQRTLLCHIVLVSLHLKFSSMAQWIFIEWLPCAKHWGI